RVKRWRGTFWQPSESRCRPRQRAAVPASLENVLMTIRFTRRVLCTAITALALPAVSFAQSAANWPTKPIRLVVAFAAAGPADIVGRLLGDRLAEALGQPVVVENRGGAAGSLGSQHVARAEADGYTLLVTTSSYAVNPSMQRNLGFDS